jgi:hypothetical protein
MPDFDLIPRGRTLAPGTAPPLDSVLRGARRRRRVRASAVGVVAGASAIVAVLLAAPGPSSGSLKSVTPAIKPAPPSGQHRTPASAAPTTAHATTGQSSRSASGGSAGGGAAIAGSPATRSGAASGANAKGIVGPPHRMTSYDASRACNGTGPTPALGWCSYYTGATSGSAGQSVLIATDVCRLPGQSSAQLTSDNGQQAEFSVGPSAYPSLWTWSHGRRFTSTGTSITVAPGECVEWFVTWRVVEDDGRPMPAGTYDLITDPLSTPTGDNGAYVTARQKFTVTS